MNDEMPYFSHFLPEIELRIDVLQAVMLAVLYDFRK